MNGLKVLVDTIISPKEAFESLRENPAWLWGLLVAVALGVVGSLLTAPAMEHAVAANPAALFGDRYGQMTPDQVQSAVAITKATMGFGFIFVIIVAPIAALIGALVMLLFDKMGRGEGTFRQYFAAQCYIGVVIALGQIVLAGIVLLRGGDNFNTMHEVITAIPSLAWLLPGANVKLSAFFAYMTPFTLWATWLTIYAMTIIGKVPKFQAWLGGSLMLIVSAVLTAAGAK